MSKIKIGPVSEGTMRERDLIPVFVPLLKSIAPERLASSMRAYDVPGDTEGDLEEWMARYTEEQAGFCQTLFEDLDEEAPPYCYFGATPDDGACYGYFVNWESVLEARADGVIPVGNELPDKPTPGDDPYFLQVSDRGNAELFEWSHDKWVSVWAIV